jgi:Escherichia/Staphylococcus phage prohead protease
MTVPAPPRAARTALRAPFSVKSVDKGARSFRGLAATWQKDLGDDVIHKGAFARTLDHWRRTKRAEPVPLLDGHDRFSVNSVLGKMVDAEETADGLEAEFALVPDDQKADAAMRRVEGGFVTGLSIGYTPIKWEDERSDSGGSFARIRHLKEIKLHEVSLVVMPMNPGARVDPATVKSLIDALKSGELSEEDRALLLGLTAEEKAQLRALLDASPAPADGSPADTPKGLAPETQAALSKRIASLTTLDLERRIRRLLTPA